MLISNSTINIDTNNSQQLLTAFYIPDTVLHNVWHIYASLWQWQVHSFYGRSQWHNLFGRGGWGAVMKMYLRSTLHENCM